MLLIIYVICYVVSKNLFLFKEKDVVLKWILMKVSFLVVNLMRCDIEFFGFLIWFKGRIWSGWKVYCL